MEPKRNPGAPGRAHGGGISVTQNPPGGVPGFRIAPFGLLANWTDKNRGLSPVVYCCLLGRLFLRHSVLLQNRQDQTDKKQKGTHFVLVNPASKSK